MVHSNLMAACALLATSLGGLQALADVGDTCGQAIPPAPTCAAVQMILVPEIVYETRTVTTVCQRPETRERTVVVNRPVSQMQDVPCEYTVEVPRTRVRQVTDIVERPVAHAFVMRTTIDVPRTETRVATRMVSRLVPVQEERTVCEVTGHWQPQAHSVAYSPQGNGIQGAINAPSPNSAPPEPPAPSNQTFQPPSSRPNPPDCAAAVRDRGVFFLCDGEPLWQPVWKLYVGTANDPAPGERHLSEAGLPTADGQLPGDPLSTRNAGAQRAVRDLPSGAGDARRAVYRSGPRTPGED